MLNAREEAGKDWWPLSGCNSGRIRLGIEWKPLNIAGSLHGPSNTLRPSASFGCGLKKATDVKNVERPLVER